MHNFLNTITHPINDVEMAHTLVLQGTQKSNGNSSKTQKQIMHPWSHGQKTPMTSKGDATVNNNIIYSLSLLRLDDINKAMI